ncbi:MAG: Gfo/Idh/MocA family oxidoreductase [Phycisphaeraceae bacterium]|nr:Gfo/Idh/MocA family oxidoreductase [Phycisphaeraceae bacterium]
MTTTQIVHLGVIGAGAICRDRHLPALRDMAGVKLSVVCNRSPQSRCRMAEQFGFADIESDWRALVQRDDIDAVLIGTWPYTHAEMSITALDAGMHVFCQARMAATLDEARAMVDAAAACRDMVNQVCPPPMRMPFEPNVKKLLADGALGELRLVRIEAFDDSCLGPLHWHQRVATRPSPLSRMRTAIPMPSASRNRSRSMVASQLAAPSSKSTAACTAAPNA